MIGTSKNKITIYISIHCFRFLSPSLADFKGNAIMNLSTINNTKIMKNSIKKNSIKSFASKIHDHGLFKYFFTYNQ